MTAVRKLEIRVDQTGDAGKGLQGLKGSLKKITTPAAVAVGAIAAVGVAAIAAGSYLIGLGSDAEEMKGKFDVVFGKAGPDAIETLDEFGNVVGRNKFDLMGMASSTQDLLVPMGFARDEAAGMSVDITQLAVDVGSFNNAVETDVQRDFNSAMTGSHETVKKYGIIINDATLNQELMRMGIEDGMKSATEQEKVQARLNLIYAGTTDAQGDAARTAGSWANQMRGLKSSLKEAATTMGVDLLPILTPILATFTEWVVDIMPKAVEIFKEFTANFKENVGPAMDKIKDAIDRISVAFGVQSGEISAADVILWVFKATLDTIVVAFQIVAWAAQNVAWAIEQIKKPIDNIIAAFDTLKEVAKSALDSLPDWIKPGSPTPFEIGLRGIADAAKRVNMELGGMGMAPMAGVGAIGGAGAGAGITVNLTYSPAVSLANQYEAQERLGPYIAEYLRKEGY